jgi:NADPH:quinone reductase-like Zn-dependent oxidoreductase
MVLRLGLKYRLPVLHIVHRPPLVELLRGMGAEHVLDSSAEGFGEALEEWARRFQATCALDAVGGELTGLLLSAMPRRSIVVVYGALAGTPCRIEPTDLIFRQKRVIGFWLTDWFAQQNAFLRPFRLRPVRGMLDRELRTDIAARLTLEQAARDLGRHLGNASKGKILIVPSSRDAMLV